VQRRATGSAHDHQAEMKIMRVHLRFMTTAPLRLLPPLHINSPPVVLREKDMTFCPDSMGLHQVSSIFNFRFRARRWAGALLAKRTSARPGQQLTIPE
jgi:hypothetical protein